MMSCGYINYGSFDNHLMCIYQDINFITVEFKIRYFPVGFVPACIADRLKLERWIIKVCVRGRGGG